MPKEERKVGSEYISKIGQTKVKVKSYQRDAGPGRRCKMCLYGNSGKGACHWLEFRRNEAGPCKDRKDGNVVYFEPIDGKRPVLNDELEFELSDIYVDPNLTYKEKMAFMSALLDLNFVEGEK